MEMTNNELLLAMSSILDEKLKSEMQSMGQELRAEMQSMGQELRTEMRSMKEELQSEIQSVRDETMRNSLILENDVLPRLQNIESCYTDTYSRYRKYGDKMDAVFTDVELLKKVVQEHSEKLQNIS